MPQQQPPPPSSSARDGSGDNDLPSSLPSYMPLPSSQGASGGAVYSYNLLNQSLAKPDGDATPRQWKSRPVRCRSTSARLTDTDGLTESHLIRLQPSPSEGMRSMTFQEGGRYQMQSAQDTAMMGSRATDVSMATASRQDATSAPQISAAQFAASTGGLSMDTALLARVSGTDPSLIGSEDIKQIMCTPDLLSIYQKLQEEDDRRQRRLERNRASARVRREKKKGMVETYEGEVSKLESALNVLQKHEFGTGNARELATALGTSVDRYVVYDVTCWSGELSSAVCVKAEYSSGEHLRNALLSKDAKMELMARILGQHSKNTDAVWLWITRRGCGCVVRGSWKTDDCVLCCAQIRRANAENQALIAVASNNSELFVSLRKQLGLTDTQCQQIASLAIPASEEARKLDAILKCFSALRAHDWLYVPGIEVRLLFPLCLSCPRCEVC